MFSTSEEIHTPGFIIICIYINSYREFCQDNQTFYISPKTKTTHIKNYARLLHHVIIVMYVS